ncbi:pyridoxal phosphate-dependent transferase [Hypoxylon sp. FL0890]|nr:pyridoxal phosphate-dependent transferase [Hypoxylon sp. FL0890]
MANIVKPAERVLTQGTDVWSIINNAAANSPVQPIANLGQGFFGYNPPAFIREAAKQAIDREDCNQYASPKGRASLRKAIAESYSPLFGKDLNQDTEVLVTTGANEGMLSAFMAFLDPGDEVIVFEPVFDQYISNIEMPGAKVVYVSLLPPPNGTTHNTSAADWRLDLDALKRAITPKTKMIVANSPHNPTGKVFSREELLAIGEICVQNNILILSDEVYDRMSYVPFTRIATLSPEIARLTLTVGSAGKSFWATGWRVGWLIGPEHLIRYCTTAHTRICYCGVSPLQEGFAIGFEHASQSDFWERSKNDMALRMNTLNEVWDELALPYSKPDGGYLVLVNFAKVKLPEEYIFPPALNDKPRDFKLAWFLIMELGVAAIPTSVFFADGSDHKVEDWLRFSVCRNFDVLETAKSRLRGLRKYIQT